MFCLRRVFVAHGNFVVASGLLSVVAHELSSCVWAYCPTTCGIFVPWPGIRPSSPALEGGVFFFFSLMFHILITEHTDPSWGNTHSQTFHCSHKILVSCSDSGDVLIAVIPLRCAWSWHSINVCHFICETPYIPSLDLLQCRLLELCLILLPVFIRIH